jgi:hypothetical protein
LLIGFIEPFQLVSASKDCAVIVLHTSQIFITTLHIKSSQFPMSSPVVA